jgi:hypothetical protein
MVGAGEWQALENARRWRRKGAGEFHRYTRECGGEKGAENSAQRCRFLLPFHRYRANCFVPENIPLVLLQAKWAPIAIQDAPANEVAGG